MAQKDNGSEDIRAVMQKEGGMEKIIGIGIDLIERERVEKSCRSDSFLRKCFSERERQEIAAHPKRAATDFAGKEAVAKAFGTGFAGISPAEIEILRKESGAPQVFLQGRAKEQAEQLGVTAVHISLTDSKELAGAYVVCTGDDSLENSSKEPKNVSEESQNVSKEPQNGSLEGLQFQPEKMKEQRHGGII